jgi:methionyl-tRNA formyltransferase
LKIDLIAASLSQVSPSSLRIRALRCALLSPHGLRRVAACHKYSPGSDMRILLLAEEAAGLHLFRMLAAGPHQLAAVMTSPPKQGASGPWRAAENEGYAVRPAALVKDPDFPDWIRAQRIDLLLNIHSLIVLPAPVLDAPRYGCFNLHPAPLPAYAGLNSVSWAIYHGESRHGVTLHKMVPAIDAGPIVDQAYIDIAEDEAAISVFTRCVKQGLPLVYRLLQIASDNPQNIPLRPQDLSRRRYFGREIPNHGRIVWSSPAKDIVNFVRACDFLPFQSAWGHPQTTLNGEELLVLKASRTGQHCEVPPGTIGQPRASDVPVAASDEWVLVHSVIKARRSVDPRDVLLPGARLQDEAAALASAQHA